MARVAAIVALIACAVAGVWYYRAPRANTAVAVPQPVDETAWIEQLYNANPVEVEAATRQVQELGPKALPLIHQTFQDPNASTARVKAALKACGILGPTAAPAIAEVAEQLPDPTLTAEAAVALSFMGRGAFGPLRDALAQRRPRRPPRVAAIDWQAQGTGAARRARRSSSPDQGCERLRPGRQNRGCHVPGDHSRGRRGRN